MQSYIEIHKELAEYLTNDSIQAAFSEAESKAKAASLEYHWLGTGSIALAAVSLLFSAIKLYPPISGSEWAHSLVWITSCTALLAIFIIITVRTRSSKSRWLAHRLHAELLRQIHFRVLLDGRRLESHAMHPESLARIHNPKLGDLDQYMNGGSVTCDWFMSSLITDLEVSPSLASDAATQEKYFELYRELRIRWQAKYFLASRDRLAFQDEVSETIARCTIFGAVLVATAELAALLRDSGGVSTSTKLFPLLAVTAIILAVLSAVLRVFRSASGISERREHYEVFSQHIRRLETAFDVVQTPREKLEIMRTVELTLIEELRGFLRIAHKSNYLF